MRKSSHPRVAHLHEELHVEIVAFAPPAEAYARMAYALTQVRRYLIPDNNDQVRVWGRGRGEVRRLRGIRWGSGLYVWGEGFVHC